MKYIKKFNEELSPKTYLKAADKLSYNHPDRSKKLKDYASSKLNTYTIVSDRFEGELKVKIESSSVIKRTWREASRPSYSKILLDVVEDLRLVKDEDIYTISITDSGIGYGYENINRCYCINREEAFKLHNELLKFGMNVPVNDLYTTRDLLKKTNKTKPESPEKKPWYRRR